jgi:hypothetical protein
MSRQQPLYEWIGIVATHFPHLSKPQATVLALWSFGMVLARSCALSAVALVLALLLGRKLNTMRQRLREWYWEAQAKKGSQRQELDVTTCFAPLLGWLVHDWSSQRLALAVDATTLGARFVVLAISVVYRGCAIPVAWKVISAQVPHPWKDEWLALLNQFQAVVPRNWTVIVLADRGLYARWLFQAIERLHWHPLLRIKAGGSFRPQGWFHFYPLSFFAPHPRSRWQGLGTAFATPDKQLSCTLLAYWGEGHEEAWFVLTDLPPQNSDACWYGLRSWIEQGFKISKRAGWQWQRTRITDPERATRLWLAVAVATLWLVSVGGAADANVLCETLPSVQEVVGSRYREARQRSQRWRLVSVFRLGWVILLLALLQQDRLPVGRFVPEILPARTDIQPP